MTKQCEIVPCGKCPQCRKRRSNGWAFRLMQQEKVSSSSLFITLTYATENVPITEKGSLSLRKRDVQLFFKRLRKSHTNGKAIKYYAVGEYGSKTFRPHYHVILFNADIEKILPAWSNGEVHYGEVTDASIVYTLKYMCKPGIIKKGDSREKEFSLMSKGLGINYLSEKIMQWHYADVGSRAYLNLEDGKKIAMPRYYKDKLYGYDDKREIEKFNSERILKEMQRERLDEVQYHKKYRNKKAAIKAAFESEIRSSKKIQKL